jgi:methanogenic corrinoid protein MtbC1
VSGTGTARPAPSLPTFLDALRTGDRDRALSTVSALRDQGVPTLRLLDELVSPAQRRVGQLWAEDRLSVAEEHAATAVSEAVIAALAERHPTPGAVPHAAPGAVRQPAPTGRRSPAAAPVIVACVEHEWHAVPALILSEFLRADGLPVSYVGANASAAQLVRLVHDTGPVAVALSCSLGATLPRARRQVEAIRETGTPVIVGGSAFDRAGRRAVAIGANGYAADARQAAALGRSLPAAVPPADPLTSAAAEEAVVISADRERLAELVRARMDRLCPDADPTTAWRDTLADQLGYLVGCVAGALLCEDPAVLQEALDWAAEVTRVRGAGRGTALALRTALADALREHPAATALLASLGSLPDA